MPKKIIFLFSILVVLVTSIFVSENTAAADSVIRVHDDTFLLTKISSISDNNVVLSDTISLSNLGDKETKINIKFDKPNLVSHSGLSGAPSFLDLNEDASQTKPNSFKIKPSLRNFTIEPGELKKITYFIMLESDRTSSYAGKFWLYGDDFDPIPINFEVKIIHNQFEFLIFAVMGIIIAMIFGLLETWRIFRKLEEKPDANNKKMFDIKQVSNDSYWAIRLNPLIKKNNKLPKINKSSVSYLLSRLTLGGLAVGLSLPAALFGNEYFIGIPLLDVFTAAGIGFITYRAQDLKKLSRGDTNSV